MATITEARDEMMGVFRTAWLADASSQDIPVLYPDVGNQKPPDSGAWARIQVRHATGNAVSLVNEVGSRRFERTGTVTVQIFTPTGDGMNLSDTLVAIAKNAFEGVTTSPGRVIFRRVRNNEIGQDGVWFQHNVLADFEYDEVR